MILINFIVDTETSIFAIDRHRKKWNRDPRMASLFAMMIAIAAMNLT